MAMTPTELAMDFRSGEEYPDAFDAFQKALESKVLSDVSPRLEYLYSDVDYTSKDRRDYSQYSGSEKPQFFVMMVFEAYTRDKKDEMSLAMTTADSFDSVEFVYNNTVAYSDVVVDVFNKTNWDEGYGKIAKEAFVLWQEPDDEEIDGELMKDSHKIIVKVYFDVVLPSQEQIDEYHKISGRKSVKAFNLDWAQGAGTDEEYPDAFSGFLDQFDGGFGGTSEVAYSYVRSIEGDKSGRNKKPAEYYLHFVLDFYLDGLEKSDLNEVLDEMDVVFCDIWTNSNSLDCKYLQEKFNDEFAGVLEATQVVTQRIEPDGESPVGVWVNIYFNVLS